MSLPIDEVSGYLTSNGLKLISFQGADSAYGYRENEPVFAIIADQGDGSMAFQNAMNLYWATAEYISKPWCLIMVMGAPMIPHHRQMLDNLSTQFNIRLIEGPQEGEVLEEVMSQLDDLVAIMHRYVGNVSDKSASLGGSMRLWKEEKPFLEDVIPVEVKLGDLSIYEENGRLAPNRTTVPLTAVSGEAEIEALLPRLVQSEPHFVFFTEHRNLPVIIKLELCKNPKLTLRFEADKGNLIEATSFESLVTSFKLTGKISFNDPNTGESVFSLSVRQHVE
jgi:hypothetical protein